MSLKFLKILVLALLLSAATAYVVDRFVLAPVCPPCHTEKTRALPLFDPSKKLITDGLVRISNGFHFRARLAGFGNIDGEGIILLHGYPETSIMWTPLLRRYAAAGYRVVAFDQRGYSPAARPGGVSNYKIEQLAADVVAVADAVGFQRFHLVGHDWGGAVSWIAADRYPDRVSTLSILSMPHPAAFSEALFSGADQLRRSSYVLLNWLPWISELVLRFNNAAYLQRVSWSDKTPEQIAEYIDVFSEPGALEAVLKWYRAHNFFYRSDIAKIRQPTLYIWGNQDKALGRVGADKTPDYVAGPFQFVKLNAGHALLTEATDTIAKKIMGHLKQWPLSRKPPLPAKFPSHPHLQNAQCLPSKPHCLRINVAPDGKSINLDNRCQERFAGTLRLKCSNWQQDATLEYYFDLKPGSTMVNRSFGLDYGTCYYDQKVCAPE